MITDNAWPAVVDPRYGLRGLKPSRLIADVGRSWRQPGYLLELGALVLAYYAAAHLGYALGFSGPVAAVVWLPVGVGIAFLYLRGLRFWPGVVIGDLLVNSYATLPVGSALAQSFGNLLEVVVATILIRRLCPPRRPLSTIAGVGGLIAAIACGTLVSATIGSIASWLGGVIGFGVLVHVWRTWWLGDFCGALIVVPLAISWARLPARPWKRARVIEAGLSVAAVAGLSALALIGPPVARSIVFPALIWAALRFGQRGATVAVTIVSGFTIWAAVRNVGVFAVVSIDDRVLGTQMFIAAASVSALVVAALVWERERLEDNVRASRARLVAASDEARRRLERDLHDGAQQDLVGLRLKLEQAAELIPQEPIRGSRIVSSIGRQMDDVLDQLRALAGGIYPSVLRAHGLAEALKSAARRSQAPVSFRSGAIGRYGETVEVAVYFCCLEAIQNVSKHAGPNAEAEVRLQQQNGQLLFEVSDNGHGFEPEAAPLGDGLANMQDRIEAIGGRLVVSSSVGYGTIVYGRVPV